MNDLPITDIALEGFRLTRENVRAVAVWAAVRAVFALLVLLLLDRFAGQEMTAFLHAMRNFGDVNDLSTHAAPLAPIFLLITPFDLGLQAILSAACFRTVLGPKDADHFHLALGPYELRLLVLNILAVAAVFVAAATVGMIGDLVATVAAAGGAAGALLQALYGGAAIFAVVFVALRLSLAPALTFATGRIAVLESWEATKGRETSLAGAYLMAAGLSGLIYVLGVVIGAAPQAFDPSAASNWTSPGALTSAAWMAAIGELIAVIVTAPGGVAARLLAKRALDRA